MCDDVPAPEADLSDDQLVALALWDTEVDRLFGSKRGVIAWAGSRSR